MKHPFICVICQNDSKIKSWDSSEQMFKLDTLEDVLDKTIKSVSLCKICSNLLSDLTDFQEKVATLTKILQQRIQSVSYCLTRTGKGFFAISQEKML